MMPADAGAMELQRLQDREIKLILQNSAMQERAAGFEAEANQAYCETRLLRNECIRLRNLNSVLSGFIEFAHSEEITEELATAMDAEFPPDVDALVKGTRVQSPTSAEVLDQALAVLWERLEHEEYGHAKAAVALDIEAITELRDRLAKI